jgi:hypothetical protein
MQASKAGGRTRKWREMREEETDLVVRPEP